MSALGYSDYRISRMRQSAIGEILKNRHRDPWRKPSGDGAPASEAQQTTKNNEALSKEAQQLKSFVSQVTARSKAPQRKPVEIEPAVTAEELRTMTFTPIKYVVPGVIVEGLTLMAGKPKIGKSWLLLHSGIAVATGGKTLGNILCEQGDVLYCALEDNPRRLQSRMDKLLGFRPWPARLSFRWQMPRMFDGGLEAIKQWIVTAEHPRLVIIDTLAMIRSLAKRNDQPQYNEDYLAVLDLRTFAYQHGVAVVLVHHQRKMEADDIFDTISGTLGLTGAPDTILVVKKDFSNTFVLHGRGRDVAEIEKVLTFEKETCLWTMVGDWRASCRD